MEDNRFAGSTSPSCGDFVVGLHQCMWCAASLGTRTIALMKIRFIMGLFSVVKKCFLKDAMVKWLDRKGLPLHFGGHSLLLDNVAVGLFAAFRNTFPMNYGRLLHSQYLPEISSYPLQCCWRRLRTLYCHVSDTDWNRYSFFKEGYEDLILISSLAMRPITSTSSCSFLFLFM